VPRLAATGSDSFDDLTGLLLGRDALEIGDEA
jgi:hypothetical protein